ncbi:hypothetical protein V6N13_047919 [Hibiscus sabdariffa]
MERDPKYKTYVDLRENKLRMKFEMLQEWEEIQLKQLEFKQTPTKKPGKFSPNSGVSNKGPSVLAQSVPDFSVSLWKENRKPAVMNQTETTPLSTGNNWSNSIGSKFANSGEKKKRRLVMTRKSYASVKEMKAINGGSREGNSSARLF